MDETPQGRFEVNPDLAAAATTDPEIPAVQLPPGVFLVGAVLPEDRVELFRVNGRVYTLPKRVDPRVLFRFMKAQRKARLSGTDEFGSFMLLADLMYEIVGEAVIDALAEEELGSDEIRQVMDAIGKYAMSANERAGLGNSSNRPVR